MSQTLYYILQHFSRTALVNLILLELSFIILSFSALLLDVTAVKLMFLLWTTHGIVSIVLSDLRFLRDSSLPVCLDPLEQRLEGNPHPRRSSLPVQEATSPPPAAERSPSPARNPQSEVLHVKNLVRPFTLNQLKDLLGKHGTLVEGGFWIDKIKSHCYVVVRVVVIDVNELNDGILSYRKRIETWK